MLTVFYQLVLSFFSPYQDRTAVVSDVHRGARVRCSRHLCLGLDKGFWAASVGVH